MKEDEALTSGLGLDDNSLLEVNMIPDFINLIIQESKKIKPSVKQDLGMVEEQPVHEVEVEQRLRCRHHAA